MLLSKFTGKKAKQTVGFNLISNSDKISIEMISKKYRLNLSSSLFEHLNKERFEYVLS